MEAVEAELAAAIGNQALQIARLKVALQQQSARAEQAEALLAEHEEPERDEEPDERVTPEESGGADEPGGET